VTAGRALQVVDTGPQVLVQDLGRPGWAHIGVPTSGALDPDAMALANRLVGNPEDLAGLEILLGGCSFVAGKALRVALTGGVLSLRVDGEPRAWGEAISVRAGARIDIGAADGGLRSWLAVAGGIDVSPVLGSRSTDTLTGIGPPPVRDGDLLPVGPASPTLGHGEAVPDSPLAGLGRLRCRLGPRADWFTDDAVAAFLAHEYVVAAASDRVGMRLDAAEGRGLERRVRDELASEGVVRGAVQVPANGQPLVFLADHPVTGGYPVIAVVEAADLRRCAQLRPGDRVEFVDVSRRLG
jgi:biotin-dependent carboxylase-like uncharacterized protein